MAKLQQFFAIAFVTLIFQTHLIAALLGLIGGVINGVAQMLSPQPNLYNQYANPFPFPPIGPNGVQKSLYDQVSPDIKMNYLQYYQTRSWPNYVYPTTGIAGAFTTVGQSIDFAVQSKFYIQYMFNFYIVPLFLLVLRC